MSSSGNSNTVPTVVVNGDFSDWTAAERIDNPSDVVAGYALYGTVQADTYLIGVQATATTDATIGAGTTIWLNTDQNAATGYELSYANIGADYNITFDASGTPYLYTGAAGGTLVSSTPLTYALSPDKESLEIAIPRSLVTPAGGVAPTSINIALQIPNSAVTPTTVGYLPTDYTSPEYTITDPATLVATSPTHKIAIVYSDTSANLYFSQTAYSDLIMAAENQARIAGVSYDLIDESKLTSVSNLIGYDAIVFPAMPDVNTAQLPAILSALTSAVDNYHISIITAGDFLTNDQMGAALPGNAYANMETLLGLARSAGGTGSTVTVTANDISNPIMKSYAAGQLIQSYTNETYTSYSGLGTTPDVLVNQNVTVGGVVTTLPGVVQTTVHGTTNVQFATTDLLGDSNLLSHAIQSVVLGTQPGVELVTSRQAGIVAVRMDMDQSQYPVDVSPTSGAPGIYSTLIPILQQWQQHYDFVGSYFINIGDNANPAEPTGTTWSVNLPYYQDLEAMGGEIGDHSYTHLVNPPAATVTATTTADSPTGTVQVTLNTLPAINGVTVGMVVTGLNIGANTIVSAVSGDTVTLSYAPGGYGTANVGVTGDIPAGTTLTFSIPTENTNFLSTTGTGPFTYDYEFNQSKTIEQTNLGITINGAAIPGANETYATDQNILPYYPSVAATATTSGSTGYVTGGWTGVGSGYPSAIGYMSPTDEGSVYIAPNMTFDFTEIQYEGKTVAQAEADWTAQFDALTANAAGTPVVVLPVHDYGVAAWNTDTNSATGSPYTTQMYTQFIATAYADNYEFLTLEQLASRVAAQQAASINYTTVGNTITATVTPAPTAPDIGGMALNVINGGTDVIQNVTNWYAYNAQEVFMPTNGGTFVINLGTTQDDVTHIESLPMRCDLVSCTGDGSNLGFSITGDGEVVVDLKNPTADIVSIQGAPTASLTGAVLDLTFADMLVAPLYAPLTHTVAIEEGATGFKTAGNDIVIGTTGNDIFTAPGGGTDTIIGNGGSDIMMYDGASTDYSIVTNADGSETVTDLRAGSPDGKDTLIGIASIEFAPSITSIVASGSGITNGAGDVGVGSIVTLTVNFNEAVTVGAGTPTLTLGDGGVAAYTGGSGTSALSFRYVVAAGQNTADLIVSSFNLPTGVTVQNAAAGNADLKGATNFNPTGILQIDTTAPAAPSAPVLLAALDGGVPNTITDLTTPTFTGTAEIGSKVTLFDGTAAIGTAVATVGQWSITTPILTDGSHSINAEAEDAAGNLSAASGALSVTVDPTAAANFAVLDTTTNVGTTSPGVTYTGPVAGLQNQYINITNDSLNITALVPNSFIHSGSGEDAIDVSKVGGTNVLDGSTGSNFLVGGSGNDTFFVDDRAPAADVWSTVANFHKGDAATIWGVTATDFNLAWVNGQGATGYTGLTLHVTEAGAPTASLTLAGYTEADLSNGRLSISFGNSGGSNYMYIHGNG